MGLTDPYSILIEDVENGQTQTLAELSKHLNNDEPGDGKIKRQTYTNAFLSNLLTGERYKILALIFKYNVKVHTEMIEIHGDSIISAVVKNITEGITKFIRFDGRVSEE